MANFSTSFANVVDTAGKFATGANDTEPAANLPPVSRIPVCHWCKQHRWQTMGTIINWWQLKINLKKNIYQYANSTTQRCPKEIMNFCLIEDFLCNLPPVLMPVKCTLSKEFSKKIETALMVYNQGLRGNSWHCPFNGTWGGNLDKDVKKFLPFYQVIFSNSDIGRRKKSAKHDHTVYKYCKRLIKYVFTCTLYSVLSS